MTESYDDILDSIYSGPEPSPPREDEKPEQQPEDDFLLQVMDVFQDAEVARIYQPRSGKDGRPDGAEVPGEGSV